MHEAARRFVSETIQRYGPFPTVLEYGSANVNGEVRSLFTGTTRYHGIDVLPGPGVDEVADACTYQPDFVPAAILCCNVFEHVAEWPGMIDNAFRAGGGILIVQCVCDPFPRHGARGGMPADGEFYQNVDPVELIRCLSKWSRVELTRTAQGDLQALAWR
jgi:hypothetical protein